MSAPIYSTLIQTFFDKLDSMLNTFVYQGYSTLVDHLRAPLGTAVVLIIVMLGISITQGWVKLAISNFVKIALKIGLIYTFAMNWDMFSQFVVNGITVAAGDVGDWLLSIIPHQWQGGSQGINSALQLALTEFSEIGQRLWNAGGLHNCGTYLNAILIWAFGYVLVFLGVFEIVMAKILLALLFTLAPLFIGFTLFKPTYPFFDRWLGLISGYLFLFTLISATLALILDFVQWAVSDIYVDPGKIDLVGLVPALFVCFIGIGLIFRVTHLAQSLGGAVTTISGNTLLAGAVGGAVGGALAAGKLAAPGLKLVKKGWEKFAG